MKDKRKTLIISLAGLMAVLLLTVISINRIKSFLYVSTEDARIDGDLVKISPQASGRLADLFIDEGSYVEKNEIVARLEAVNLTGGALELSVVRSPINGIIIKEQGTVGEVVGAGQVLAYVINPDDLYISANIEENRLKGVSVGQPVDIRLDMYGGVRFSGTVDSIGDAANSVFSLLPSSSGSTFTKVVQKVPVRIRVDYGDYEPVIGTNAKVRIHIRQGR